MADDTIKIKDDHHDKRILSVLEIYKICQYRGETEVETEVQCFQ